MIFFQFTTVAKGKRYYKRVCYTMQSVLAVPGGEDATEMIIVSSQSCRVGLRQPPAYGRGWWKLQVGLFRTIKAP